MKAKLAFYKGKGDITDKLIRWWTKSPYSHVELVVDGWWYSTSPRDLRVRAKRIVPKKDHWDFVEVEVDEDWLYEVFAKTRGAKYDWLGIFFTQIVDLNIHSKSRYFCVEWCAFINKIPKPHRYNPGTLYNYVKGK